MNQQYELNIRDYLRIIRKQKLVIILTVALVFFISITYTSRQPVVYKASAIVKVEERKTIAGLLTEWILYNPADIMESYTKAITSFEVLKLTGVKLGIITENDPLDKISTMIVQLQGKIEVERLGNSNMIRITATEDNPHKAMNLAKAISEAFYEYSLLEKTKQFRQARQFIEEQLNALESRLSKSEERLKQFREESSQVILADPIQKKLLDLQFELTELLQKYTEKHPKVLQIKQQIEFLEKQLRGFSDKELEYARLLREVDADKKLYDLLKQRLEEARITEAERISDVSIVSPAVLPGSPVAPNRQFNILVGLLLGLVVGIALAFVRENLDTSIGTIQDVEELLKLPVLGVVPPITGLVKEKSLILKIKERLSLVSKSPQEERYIALISHYESASVAAEAFRNIQTNLKLNNQRKVILITSAGPSEGKTLITSNLGIVMAQSGLKVLLVSADLRRPKLHKIFGVDKEPGLSEILMETVDLEKTIRGIADFMLKGFSLEDIRRTPGFENIWLITSGKSSVNPANILESKNFSKLIEALKTRFDVILFDTPPLLPVTDASIVASYSDSSVIVYEVGRTSRDALWRAKVQLESTGTNIAGVILNNTKPHTEIALDYPYYKYRYYKREETKS